MAPKKNTTKDVGSPAIHSATTDPDQKDADKATKKAGVKKTSGGVTIDPSNVALIQGNSVSFVAEDKDGRVMAKLTTPQGPTIIKPSRNAGYARIGWIVQGAGEVSVEFSEDGKAYAEGTWPIG